MSPDQDRQDPTYAAGHALLTLAKVANDHSVTYAMVGRLHLSNGQLLLTVPSSLLRGAFDAIDEPGMELPPQRGVTVMTSADLDKIGGPDKITERGHQFSYTLGATVSHSPNRAPFSKVINIRLFSPDLRKLRLSYGLSAHPSDQSSFMLPIAVRRPGVLHYNDVTKIANHTDPIDWDTFDKQAIFNGKPFEMSPAELSAVLSTSAVSLDPMEDVNFEAKQALIAQTKEKMLEKLAGLEATIHKARKADAALQSLLELSHFTNPKKPKKKPAKKDIPDPVVVPVTQEVS